MGASTRTRAKVWVALVVVAAAAAPVRAHNVAADLSVWGNFGATTARCQRTIARAATYCVGRVLAVRTDCLGGELADEPCDQEAADQAVEATRQRAAALVARDCSAADLQVLRYVDLSDAQTDVVDVCRGLDTSTRTAAYGPALIGSTVAEVDPTEQACLDIAGRTAGRLLRYAMRARAAALDEIAATSLTLEAKQALLERSARTIARARALSERRILARCAADDFSRLYGRGVGEFLGNVAGRADCLGEGVYVQNAVRCPPAVCGDGMQVVPDEECDDGNDYEGDGCRGDCIRTECDVFPTTYDLIQRAIFENHGCTDDACHGSARSGGLDLRAAVSYANLIDVDAESVTGWKRIDAGNHDRSLLWRNLAARTRDNPALAPLRGMPITGLPISGDELEALRIWIENGGAARDAKLPAAAALLDACVPEPEPIKIEPLPPPAPGEGIQLHMPPWTLPPQSESEVCYASYYDVSDRIPLSALSADGQRFRYKTIDVRQDPLSHHLIVELYRGAVPPDDPIWGPYTCTGGDKDGQACDPLALGFCGSGDCATDPDHGTIACIGFGAQTDLSTLAMGGLVFAQETTALFRFPDLVYDELPVRGLILWNSHGFNLTRTGGSLEGWLNIYFPEPDQQAYQQRQLYDVSKIFWTPRFPPFPLPAIMPFEDQEVCNVHEFHPLTDDDIGGSNLLLGETAHIFELGGHMHERGVRFQILRGRFTCDGGPSGGEACSPFEAETCPAAACVDEGGRDPQQALLYTNFVYNDPVVLRLDDDPLLIDGDAPRADRTLTYCAHYDNGAPPNIQKVKRRSTSPAAGVIYDIFPIGGPCEAIHTRCIGGPHHNQPCNGESAACDSSPGAGDGDCDACPLTGGFRTTDEMFILIGNYWVTQD
jgi:cysteine-rich repeat protein